MPQFLKEDEWKTVGEFKTILRDASQLTTVCQKLNGACGPVLKSLHDSLSRTRMCVINADHWNSDKDMMHSTRSAVNVNSFTKAEKTCKMRAFLECEISFFNNESEITFAEANSDFCMNLSNR